MPRRIPFITSVAALALALSLAGCSADSAGTADTAGATASTTLAATSADTSTDVAADTHFDDDDLGWDHDGETAIALKDGASTSSADGATVDGDSVTITEAGDYRISGTLSDGNITVEAPDDAVVRLILDGAALSNSTGSPVTITAANEVLIYLEDGTSNTISDATTYTDTGDEAPNAAIFSRADLTIAGSGTLDVTGNYNDAINVTDGLVIASGSITTTAADDGIRGKDYVALLGGTVKVTADDDGVKADNDEDEGRGWLLVQGGTLDVSAGDDGVKAYNKLAIAGGKVTVSTSEEGLEAAHLDISGGTVDVTSSDDGLNAAGGASGETSTGAGPEDGGTPPDGEMPAAGEGGEPGGTPPAGEGGGGSGEMPGGGAGGETVGDYSLVVSGGNLTITADGDGLDSNGTATISGGTTVINGPTSDGNGPLDVNGEFTVTGGSLVAAGSSGMAVTPGDTSTQAALQAIFDEPLAAGTVVQVTDADDAVLATFTTTRQTASVIYSGPGMTDGQTYTILTGGTSDTGQGLGKGTTAGASRLMTVTAGEYTSGGMGGGRG